MSADDLELLGLLVSLGIVKGKPFDPDARMRKIRDERAETASGRQRRG